MNDFKVKTGKQGWTGDSEGHARAGQKGGRARSKKAKDIAYKANVNDDASNPDDDSDRDIY